MSEKILHIHHGVSREDRVSRILESFGFASDWVNPVEGTTLPSSFDDYAAVVVYGGVHSSNDPDEHVRNEIEWIRDWVLDERPYLGLCLGGQLLAKALGAEVKRHPKGLVETGFNAIYPVNGGAEVFGDPMHVYQWHNEGFDLPDGCELLASGLRFPNQAFRYRPHIVGLQFHPEVDTNLMLEWFADGAHALTHASAHPAESHLRDASLFDSRVEAWIHDFLKQWTDQFGTAPASR